VPLIEAMRFELPVVAYDSSAVAETLDGTGILVREKRHAEIAELIHCIMKDDALRSELVQKQRRRVAYYDYASTSTRLMEAIGSFVQARS